MRFHSVDYRRGNDYPPRAGTLLNRGFWFYQVPRLIPLCRLLGHKAVVDGVDFGTRGKKSRWVCCDRCGVRPDPQGRLDPETHHIGQPFRGHYDDALPEHPQERARAVRERKETYYRPGPWPQKPVGEIGGQLVLGRSFGGIGVEVKVGNGGSEHTLAASIQAHHLFSLYLHTQGHGTWLQRRLNPTGYQSRVIELALRHRRLQWRLWCKRNESSCDTPRWQDGSVRVDPRDIVLGPVLNRYTDVGEPVEVVVRMPQGDDHTATVQLQKIHTGRKRWFQQQSWCADWTSRPGIPTKRGDRGHILGSSVELSHAVARSRGWAQHAAAAIAAQMAADRARNDYEPQPVDLRSV
jgi:hypothetical protein